jgi:exodeoxyribonuclease V beta subunit
MSAGDTVHYPFPEELARIPRDRSAVIAASAGTGKTYLIEHLVVDRLVRGEARLDEMLVVTFTERAAAELRRRIQSLIDRVRTAGETTPPSGPSWLIDAGARARLVEAARGIDGASIATIHAFCQRVLTEQAFASGRLLVQQSVESRAAFAAAFAEVLRHRLAVDEDLAPYLEGYLAAGHSVEDLEQLLYQARQLRASWRVDFDPERLARAGSAFASLPPAQIDAEVARGAPNRTKGKAVEARLRLLHRAALQFDGDRDTARFLAAIDFLVKEKDLFVFVGERLGPAAAALAELVAELGEVAVPLDTVVAQRLGPPVAERLAERKTAAGLYDFDDMLELVDLALRGPRGPELVASLRRRFKLAIVDEFQDTDPLQWRIFRTIFQADATAGAGLAVGGDAGRPLYLVGDPKQSIYGFRGADVATFTQACGEVASPSETHHLSRNFRSTATVIDAYNAILDQEAAEPFFSAGGDYRPPVVWGGAVAETGAEAGPPLTLLRVTADDDVARLPMRAVREGLSRAIADEIARLLRGPSAPPARQIFVLTRTWREAAAAATALRDAGVPHVLYNQEGLYLAPEARQIRDLLRAIADPHDRGKRLRAWLTPFFGLALGDLPAAAAAGAEHPLYARLADWYGVAATQPLDVLYARILDDSGVILRELFLGESARRLTNIRHLFDVLSSDAARAARPLGEVVRRLSALAEGLIVPAPEEGNVQRLENDRDAVQVMTMHKAKGLEADFVFLYGGYSPSPSRGVRSYTEEGRRWALAGPPRHAEVVKLIKRERDGEDQRLYYVALTRARRRLYLSYSGNVESDEGLDASAREDLWKLNGGYNHVNRRLRALAADPQTQRHFETRDVPIASRGGEGGPTLDTAGLSAWRPEEAPAPVIDPELARLRRRRLGPRLTSYSRIKHAEGGYRPPTEIADEAVEAQPATEPPAAPDDQLPGGARAGIFLHDLLEKAPLEGLRGPSDLETWAARPEIQALIQGGLRRHGRDPRQAGAAARLVYAALTAPLPVVGGTLPGLAHAARVAREMEFLFPFPAAAGGADRGFVKGFVDVIFEHGGRAYFGDWKTDRLPAWDAATIDAHVARNYALQEQLYALALLQMLGVTDEASYEARFGGTLYLFVRGMPAAVRSRRPSYAEVSAWRNQIADKLGASEDFGAGGESR